MMPEDRAIGQFSSSNSTYLTPRRIPGLPVQDLYVELDLRARVRAGDPDAFGVLFDECAQAVYNHAFRLTGNWSAAEEAVSLTFLEAWRLRLFRLSPESFTSIP